MMLPAAQRRQLEGERRRQVASPPNIISLFRSPYRFLIQLCLCICTFLFSHSSCGCKFICQYLFRTSFHFLCLFLFIQSTKHVQLFIGFKIVERYYRFCVHCVVVRWLNYCFSFYSLSFVMAFMGLSSLSERLLLSNVNNSFIHQFRLDVRDWRNCLSIVLYHWMYERRQSAHLV